MRRQCIQIKPDMSIPRPDVVECDVCGRILQNSDRCIMSGWLEGNIYTCIGCYDKRREIEERMSKYISYESG